MEKTYYIDWEPQDRQLAFLKACGLSFPFQKNLKFRPSGSRGEEFKPAVADIVGYGGAAGGGKTDALLGIATVAAFAYPRINIAYFRREFPMLEGLGGAIPRSLELLSDIAKYNDQKHKWLFPTQSKLQYYHCKDPKDIYNYKSQQFDILLIDETTEWFSDMVDFLITRNRATIEYPTFKPFAAFATNPGDIGHTWFKKRFIGEADRLYEKEKVFEFRYPTGITRKHIFIPSKLSDNQILEQRDPEYRIRLSTDEYTRRIYLEGDWNVFAGQAFSELSPEVHVVEPFELPQETKYFAGYDKGYAHPCAFVLFAITPDNKIYVTNYYTSQKTRIDVQATYIKKLIGDIKIHVYCGTDCWNKDNGPSIVEQLRNELPNCAFIQANTDRVNGVAQIRKLIAYQGTKSGDPQLKFFRNVEPVFEVVASMQYDDKKPEDVLKVDANDQGEGGDDLYDAFRYGLVTWLRPPKVKKDVKAGSGESIINEIKRLERMKRSAYL